MAHLKKDFPFHKVFDNKYAEQSYIAYLSKGKKKYVMNTYDFVRRDVVIVIDFIIRCNNAIGSRKPKDKNIEELADLLEVIYAATKARGYSIEELEKVRVEKVEKRGGFDKKILLKKVIEE